MFDLILAFTGLCAFVPDRPVDNHPNRLTVALVKAQATETPHIATLLINKKFVNEALTTIKLLEEPNHPEFYYFHLKGFRIRVFPNNCDEEGGCLSVRYSGGTLGECPNACNREDIYWVGSMKEISKMSGEMSRVCHKNPERTKDRVAAHFVIEEGELTVADFSRYRTDRGSGPIIKWEVDRPGRDFRQALADLVTVTRSFQNDVTPYLQFERFVHGRWVHYGSLAVAPDGDFSLIEIKNVPEDQVCPEALEDVKGLVPRDLADILYDPHFAEFYRLLYATGGGGGLDYGGDCDEDLDVWKYADELCRGVGARLNDPQCPTAWFEPSP